MSLKLKRKTLAVLVPLCFIAPMAHAQLKPVDAQTFTKIHKDQAQRSSAALAHAKGLIADLNLGSAPDFATINNVDDEFGQSHTRLQQLHNGIKVWGGIVIAHTDATGSHLPITDAALRLISIDTKPHIPEGRAIEVAVANSKAKGPVNGSRTAELVVYPKTRQVIDRSASANDEVDATMVKDEVEQYVLAYHVHIDFRNVEDRDRSYEFIIDANDGSVIKEWSSFETVAATGTGSSHYSGSVSLSTNSIASGFEMRDMTRGTLGTYSNNVVLQYNASGTTISDIYKSSTNSWGDGAAYIPGGSAANSQTDAVDAAYGISVAWDYFRYVHGRLGVDGKGTSVYAIVHDPFVDHTDWYGLNAAWTTSCMCIRFGIYPYSPYYSFTPLDAAAHELTHGVTAYTAGLLYNGESGGLNEATSDIFGTMSEFYARGGGWATHASTVPTSGGNWTLGEGIFATPLRYMQKPSLDGESPDAWQLNIGTLDVHNSSGPMNRAFYFLSQGATVSGDSSTSYLPSGMAGIGNNDAARIWFRALSAYLTVTANYAGARQAAISAAKDIFGGGSRQEQAVWNAFHGINVGAAWTSPTCGILDSGRELFSGESISSCNGSYSLVMQQDGNLVQYQNPGVALWNSGTGGNGGTYSAMQADGNLVVYKLGTVTPAWSSGTYYSPGSSLAVSNDGNMVLTGLNGVPLWYRFAPASAANVFNSANTNTSFSSAEVVATSKTGIKGVIEAFSGRYFKITIPAGKTVTVDYIGAWFAKELPVSQKYTVELYDSTQSLLQSSSSNDSNTRVTQSYTNSGGTSKDVYIRVWREKLTTDSSTYGYSIGLTYN